jgi:predicted nucleic acid-binding protein
VTFTAPPAPIVVDASIAVEGYFRSPVATAVWQRWAADGRTLLAPAIVWPEVANALVRRHRVPSALVTRHLDDLIAAGLETADRGPIGVAFAAVLAERHGLSVYDATALWLAIDVDGELATFDRALAAAAVAEGVAIAEGLEPTSR